MVVVGAGFGGLGAAVALAERGVRVRVLEALRYPGGCASTFTKLEHRFDAGATLSTGLADGQLFATWIARYGLPCRFTFPDPVMTLRASGLELPVWRDRQRFRRSLEALPGAPVAGLRRFFALQDAVAGALWRVLDDPTLLPPLSMAAVATHLRHAASLVPAMGLAGRTLGSVLRRCGVDGFAPLRLLLDYLCQITVQCGVDQADAAFALSATDYPWRGTGHVEGGIGALAEALLQAVRDLGGEVQLADRVRGVARDGAGWRVTSRSGEVVARAVVANVLPAALGPLAGLDTPRLAALQGPVDAGWGAVMLYRSVADGVLPAAASHFMLVGDSASPLVDGNHTFVSISGGGEVGRAPPGRRTLTASTHVALAALQGDPAATVARVQATMRATLAARLPEAEPALLELPASPRTFARFTQRVGGAVGGAPRWAGLASYRQLGPAEVGDRLWLVGDSTFPGQSTLATAIGGHRAAEAVIARLGCATVRCVGWSAK